MGMRKEWEVGGISKYDCIPESKIVSNEQNSCHCICYIHYVNPLVLKSIDKDTRNPYILLSHWFLGIFGCR